MRRCLGTAVKSLFAPHPSPAAWKGNCVCSPPSNPRRCAHQHELIFYFAEVSYKSSDASRRCPSARVSWLTPRAGSSPQPRRQPGKSERFSGRLGLETREMENLPRQNGSGFQSRMSSQLGGDTGDLVCETQPQPCPGVCAAPRLPDPPKLAGLEKVFTFSPPSKRRALAGRKRGVGEKALGEARCLGSVHSSAAAFPKDPGRAGRGLPAKFFSSPVSHPSAMANPAPDPATQRGPGTMSASHLRQRGVPSFIQPPRRGVNPRKALQQARIHSLGISRHDSDAPTMMPVSAPLFHRCWWDSRGLDLES